MRALAAIAVAGATALSLAGPAHADGVSSLDAAKQKVLPTDVYKPTRPAAEQDGVTFHNIDVVSFLPGLVDETWIVAFGGKQTHYYTNDACFSLSGELQLAPAKGKKSLVEVDKIIGCWGAIPADMLGSAKPYPDPAPSVVPPAGAVLRFEGGNIKARCVTKDLSGENKRSPEEEKKPLKEAQCPQLAVAGLAGGTVIPA
ncbi:hypothetical protein ACWGAN_07070 [Streptomyces sp. NPDC054945]